jgi:hypothetical protein
MDLQISHPSLFAGKYPNRPFFVGVNPNIPTRPGAHRARADEAWMHHWDLEAVQKCWKCN